MTLKCINYFFSFLILISAVTTYAEQKILPNDSFKYKVGQTIVGHNFYIKPTNNTNYLSIEKEYDLGPIEIADANGFQNVDALPHSQKILIPKSFILLPKKYRKGIVINIAELRLYYFKSDGEVLTFPVALGSVATKTPEMKTWVYDKKKDPIWHVPTSIKKAYKERTGKEMANEVLPGPKNPLGHYAIYLGKKGYLIHGNDQPASIGRLVSSGCIRMFNRDIKILFEAIPKSTLVRIIYYPNKLGWQGNQLYLQSNQAPSDKYKTDYDVHDMAEKIIALAKNEGASYIDKTKLIDVLKRHSGVPTNIGERNNES